MTESAENNSYSFPLKTFSGYLKGGHVQGIAVDEEKGYIYYSFTTILVKTDFDGNIVGSVKGIAGHLGCIAFDRERRLIYGSLELKHDAIGKIVYDITGCDIASEDAFYCVKFECDSIIRTDMDAEKDNIMKAVYLPDVVRDYGERDEVSGCLHRYGCSGIDGIAYGPEFGTDNPKIMIAYGIYNDVSRTDNDYQVIMQFDPDIFQKHAKPLNQLSPHHIGTECEKRYFFYTGNTEYGIQNLEYDGYTKSYIAAVYHGIKEEFINYPMFFIDAKHPARMQTLSGRNGEKGLCLSPAIPHVSVTDSRGGMSFPWGQTGIFAFGDGRYAFSHGEICSDEKGEYAAEVVLYKYGNGRENMFEIYNS